MNIIDIQHLSSARDNRTRKWNAVSNTSVSYSSTIIVNDQPTNETFTILIISIIIANDSVVGLSMTMSFVE